MNPIKELLKDRLFQVVVVVPVALAAVYFAVVAEPRYVSEAKLTLRSVSGESVEASGILALLGGSRNNVEMLNLQDYIRSPDAAFALEKDVGLKTLWGLPGRDLPMRLWRTSSTEAFLAYYRQRVRPTVDDVTGTMTLEVQSFTPEHAKEIAEATIDLAETFTNTTTNNLAKEQLTFFDGELTRVRQELDDSRLALLQFQSKYGIMDAEEAGKAYALRVATLEGELAKAEAEFAAASSYIQPAAPALQSLRARIAGLREQLVKERSKLDEDGASAEAPLSEQALQFIELKEQARFSAEHYAKLLEVRELARSDAARKARALVVLSSPMVADDSRYPRRLFDFALTLLATFLLYAVLRLIRGVVREHKLD